MTTSSSSPELYGKSGIKIQYEMKEDMFMQAFGYYWRCKGQTKKKFIKEAIAPLIFGFIFLVGGLYQANVSLLITIAMYVSAALSLMAGLISLMLPIFIQKVWRKRYRNDEDFKGIITTTFDESGMQIQRMVNEYNYSWDKFTGYVAGPEFVYFYISDDHFIFIPWSAFTGKQYTPFAQLLDSKLSKMNFYESITQ